MRYLPLIGLTITSLFIVGCTETTVIPQAGNIFTVTTSSNTEAKSYNLSLSKAANVCEQQDARAIIMDGKTVYKGLDKSQQALVDLAGKVFTDKDTNSGLTPENYDYKTTLTFRCEEK